MTGLLLIGLLSAAVPSGAVSAQAAAAGFSQTKTVTREIMAEDGTVTVDERTVTVSADVTEDLRGRQVMTIRWSGARPSSGILGSITSLDAWTATEYPVVVLQCRGDDSASEPAARIRPETCWTSYGASERRLSGVALAGTDFYRHDRYATEAERAASVPADEDWTRLCSGESEGSDAMPKRIIPFVAADGTEYWRCGEEGQGRAPEMGVDTALGPNDTVAFTTTAGTGVSYFEVRTAAENASLGCSSAVPCAVVVVPIMGISCDASFDAQPLAAQRCNQEGLRPPGSSFSNEPYAAAVTAQYWASASNWRNRITIPVAVAPSAAICTSTEGRRTFQLYGSVLMSGAAEQWAPAYCDRPDRFVLRINDQVEATAFNSLAAGYGNGVLATYAGSSAAPLGYAPVGLTGFAVGFVIDIPGGGGQLGQLNLNPRLLAKLLTASYRGASFSPAAEDERPDLAGNPGSLQLDPEFRALNPDLDVSGIFYWDSTQLSFSQLMGLSVPSDLMTALTSYIAADPEAMAFVNGTPDPWGMRVNRAYEGISLPQADWPLADPWTQPNSTGCAAEQPIPWFNRVLAPVSDPHRLADDLLTARPETINMYDRIPHSEVCRADRSPRQNHGARAMLALITVADARRYALPTASLRTTSGTYVAPTDTSIAAAVELMVSGGPGEPFVPDADRLIASATAYPGTMVVHAALPLSGVEPDQAAVAASFVRIATSEGQVRGTKTGQLAEGYVPITATGATASLYAAAQTVADAVERQSGSVSGSGAPSGADSTTGQPTDLVGAAESPSVGEAAEPEAVPGLPAEEAASPVAPRRGLTPQALLNALRAAIPAGLAVTAAAAVGVPTLRRFRVGR
ncbi:MAG: hypothetical protein FWH11_08355 [Micrococcales bacterium]|nr:hypothetical protein [Micrococcales bacterium]